MKNIEAICKRYGIALCYIFGSQAETGKALIEGKTMESPAPGSDIDFAVLFAKIPHNSSRIYAEVSLEFEEIVRPFRADLLFLHEVDHLIQLEAINGINIYAAHEEIREEYEEKVMMFASDELAVFKLNEKDMLEAIEHGYFEFEYKAH